MEKTIRLFQSFEEADEVDVEEDLRMTPEFRVSIILELQERVFPHASEQGFARVCRVTEHEPG